MLITNGTITSPGWRRRTLTRSVNFGPLSLRFITIIILAAAALITLAQSTKSATTSYKEQALKKALAEKQKEVEEMQFEATRLQSLQAVTASMSSPSPSPSTGLLEEAQKLNFIPSNQINISHHQSTLYYP